MSRSRAALASSRSSAQSGICYSNRSYLSLTGGYCLGSHYGLSCACGPGHPRNMHHCHGPLPYFGLGPRSGNYALSLRTGAPQPRRNYTSRNGSRYALTSACSSSGHQLSHCPTRWTSAHNWSSFLYSGSLGCSMSCHGRGIIGRRNV